MYRKMDQGSRGSMANERKKSRAGSRTSRSKSGLRNRSKTAKYPPNSYSATVGAQSKRESYRTDQYYEDDQRPTLKQEDYHNLVSPSMK